MNYQINELEEDTEIMDEKNYPSVNFIRSICQWIIVTFLCVSAFYIIIDSDTLSKNYPNVVDIQAIL